MHRVGSSLTVRPETLIYGREVRVNTGWPPLHIGQKSSSVMPAIGYMLRLSPRSCKGSPDRPSPTTPSTVLVEGCTAHMNITCSRTRSLTPNLGVLLVGNRGKS